MKNGELFMFPSLRNGNGNEKKLRKKFFYLTAYINNWHEFHDFELCVKRMNPDFERLYNHYKKTKLVPLFDKLVVSFVRYVNEFIDTNCSFMYIVSEDLLINWKCKLSHL